MKPGPRSRVRRRNTSPRPPRSPRPAEASPTVGIPPLIMTAAVRYAEWRDGFRESGLSEDAMHEAMRARAEQVGGVLEPGETINLRSWSERTGIPQLVLEALVLAAHRSKLEAAPPPPSPSPSPSPSPQSLSFVPDEGDDGPWTPSPQALRQPFVAGPPSSHHLH